MRFFFFIALAWANLFFIHWLSYASLSVAFNFVLPYWGVVVGLLSGFFIGATFLVKKISNKLTQKIYFVAATALGTVFITFSIMMVYQLISAFSGFTSSIVVGALLGLSLALSAYALYNGHRLSLKEYTIPVSGLKKAVTAVHLTDIHIGTIHQKAFLKKVVETTNKIAPDVVYMTGDLFDGTVPINESTLRPLDALLAPVFFSNGNHEEYEGLQYVRETVKDINIELLENRMVFNNGIQVVGVNDKLSLKEGESLASILDSMHLDSELPTVLMYHTPVEWDSARERGIDVMLSGHTHNGQIFPFTLLVRLFFKYVQGLFVQDGKYLHVSPGTGTWGPPMRLGSRNQITTLHLVPKNQSDE
jgi:hypothetical protein